MKSDLEIQRNVINEMSWDYRVKQAEIGVAVASGVVTLTGNVSNYAKEIAALEAARRVAGVLDVANDIVVIPPDSPTITDTDIATAIRTELRWNAFVQDNLIRSTVSNGWVTLDGTTESLRQREDVEKAIHDLDGVRGVINHITVTKREIDPGSIRSAIEEALERRADREAGHIGVLVHDSIVTLSGRVHSLRERRAKGDPASRRCTHQPMANSSRGEIASRIDLHSSLDGLSIASRRPTPICP